MLRDTDYDTSDVDLRVEGKYSIKDPSFWNFIKFFMFKDLAHRTGSQLLDYLALMAEDEVLVTVVDSTVCKLKHLKFNQFKFIKKLTWRLQAPWILTRTLNFDDLI